MRKISKNITPCKGKWVLSQLIYLACVFKPHIWHKNLNTSYNSCQLIQHVKKRKGLLISQKLDAMRISRCVLLTSWTNRSCSSNLPPKVYLRTLLRSGIPAFHDVIIHRKRNTFDLNDKITDTVIMTARKKSNSRVLHGMK